MNTIYAVKAHPECDCYNLISYNMNADGTHTRPIIWQTYKTLGGVMRAKARRENELKQTQTNLSK